MGLRSNKPPEGQILHVTGRGAGKDEPGEDKCLYSEEVADEINLSALKAAIKQLPEIRAGKVMAIQKALVEGTYEIDSRKIAVVLIDETI